MDQVVLDGSTARSATVEVVAPQTVPGAARVLVSRATVKSGQSVSAGAVLAEVSGRPIILLPGDVPAYRDLSRDARGRDVEQLQRALRPLFGTPITGKCDARTMSDVAKLYKRAGYEAAGGTTPVVPAGEIAYAPSLPATVIKINIQLGVEATGSLLTLGAGTWVVIATIDAPAQRVLQAKPQMRFGKGPLERAGTSLVELRQSPGAQKGESITEALFSVENRNLTAPSPQQVVLTRASSGPGALIVPVSALWTDQDGSVSVSVVDGSNVRTVRVVVRLTVYGECAVEGELVEGDRVRVTAS